MLLFTLASLLTSASPVFGLNILGISTVTSSSHHIWFKELMRGLARNGHQIYALAMEKTEIEGAENRTRSIVFENVIDDFHDGDSFDPSQWSELGPIGIAWFLHRMSNAVCEVQIRTSGAKEALELVKKTKIDVIVQDLTSSQCFYGLWEVAKGDPVMVGFTPFGSPNWVKEVVGGHNWASIKHFPFAHSAPPYTLWKRTLNFVYFEVEDLFRRYYFMPIQQEITEKYIGKKMSTSIHDVEKKISFVLTNSYAALDQGTFLPPDAIEVGGLHVRDPKPLPEDIRKFLDGAEHGAIVISLGSQIQFSALAPEKLEVIVAAIGQLKQRILWKFESDELKDKPDNVMTKKWLPQGDVLAHPNVRILWTHAGLLSIQEAVWRGVPVVGMPFFIDQRYNIDLLVKKGVALQMDFESLSTETISRVFDEILTDRSFDLRMKQLSQEYRDRPMSPIDLAVWHVEYASRHPRRPLASPARKISRMQLNLVDVYAVLAAAILSIFSIVWILGRAILNLFRPRNKTKTA